MELVWNHQSMTHLNNKVRKENSEKINYNLERIPVSDVELEPWYPRAIPSIVGGATNDRKGCAEISTINCRNRRGRTSCVQPNIRYSGGEYYTAAVTCTAKGYTVLIDYQSRMKIQIWQCDDRLDIAADEENPIVRFGDSTLVSRPLGCDTFNDVIQCNI
ncbi:unnamed protein product [Cylicocyclus nassatus]|uniref:Uncharacterized protein n=1 Tax=Cylicocyclus nassatus TaxID=53992 RepID=A0AA36H2B6_CYLNA|nr:unnamed protein product [Cylicocyclus nassatus]